MSKTAEEILKEWIKFDPYGHKVKLSRAKAGCSKSNGRILPIQNTGVGERE